MEYMVGDINATSSAYPKYQANIGPIGQPKPRSCNLINKVNTRGDNKSS